MPGNYAETSTGTATFGGSSQTMNDTPNLAVAPASGQQQTQTTTSGDNSSTTVEKLVFGAGQVDAGELSFASQVLDADFLLSPAQPLAELSAGSSWSWQAESTDGKTHLALSGSYAGSETVTVGGQAVTADIIKNTLTLTGSVSATVTQTDDYAEGLHLVVREHQIIKGTYMGFPFTLDSTSMLASTTPS